MLPSHDPAARVVKDLRACNAKDNAQSSIVQTRLVRWLRRQGNVRLLR
jgi:hypothetical protein